ncbi:phytoene synthase [Brachybacterium endophyticum]|uniref:Phytoene synthase n=1 Tax=Brachybacterium endophyticum TaxID=2182385 RepID=A0A2U2RKG8_9MICO|nr:squalene/phytoene synthase family protein [Brachybacterium endophyticum]PWH06331.1 phytoene synthase [Brachybacterium endophyticum]
MTQGLQARAAAEYGRAARAAAGRVIAQYSTSFGLSTRLLREPVRSRVRCIYALVRVADEIVDGAAAGHGATTAQIARHLEDYEQRTEAAMSSGFSSDLVIHAFADTARRCGISTELTRPFFASMRADLEISVHDEESFAQYVDGSAEVVGLMCLRVFATDHSDVAVAPDPELVEGARRLGAAFQKVNFLRDLRDDAEGRGRAYFPGLEAGGPTEAQKTALVEDIERDLASAQQVIGLLPASSRAAVQAAHDLFAELASRLRATPAAQLGARRVRVPAPRKAVLAARAAWAGAPLRGDGERVRRREGER